MDNLNITRPNILYVDDINSNRVLFKASFENEFNVFLADSGQEAIELLKQEKILVIISDQRMPGISGTELLEIVRDEYPEIMRFMLTAFVDYQTVVDSINKGQIYGFFNKPFKMEEMRISLKKAVEVYYLRESNKRMMQEIEKSNILLRNIDKTKTDFLSIIIDEIKSPINKIKSVVHMLKDNVVTSDFEEMVNYLDISVSKLESFSLITNQIVRLNEDSKELSVSEVSLRELIEVCILEKKELLNSTQNKVQIIENVENLKVKGEFELLITCLSILIEYCLVDNKNEGILRITIGEDEDNRFIEIYNPINQYSKKRMESILKYFSEDEAPIDFNLGFEMILAKLIMNSHMGRIAFDYPEDKSVSIHMIFPWERN